MTTPHTRNPLPRWRGFNLLEKFSANDSSRSITFGRSNPPFREQDFRWIADWGFDFVRLPMSYHCWSAPERWLEMDEPVLADIDQAVAFGQRHGVHVCLNLHRAPGYCVNPPAEPRNLWRDADAQAAFCHQWATFARRYRGIASRQLSFDLVNEPPAPAEERGLTRADHERVVRAAVAAIRAVDPDRLIIIDGLAWGNEPVPEVADLRIAQSCRGYAPMGISHYRASWVNGEAFPPPQWPGGWNWGDAPWDRARLEQHYAPWAALIERGIGVHCGECGCFKHTPHAVFLAWFRDVLEILTGHGIGYALWNFRGAFGLLDSQRADAAYDDWHGHALDRQLLRLLQAH
jgi:endoglucanase